MLDDTITERQRRDEPQLWFADEEAARCARAPGPLAELRDQREAVSLAIEHERDHVGTASLAPTGGMRSTQRHHKIEVESHTPIVRRPRRARLHRSRPYRMVDLGTPDRAAARRGVLVEGIMPRSPRPEAPSASQGIETLCRDAIVARFEAARNR